jgi:hypothetical protein
VLVAPPSTVTTTGSAPLEKHWSDIPESVTV